VVIVLDHLLEITKLCILFIACLCVAYDSRNRQWLFPYSELTHGFCNGSRSVFSFVARTVFFFRYLTSVRPPSRLYVSARPALDGFTRNLILQTSVSVSSKSNFAYHRTEISGTLYEDQSTFLCCLRHWIAITVLLQLKSYRDVRVVVEVWTLCERATLLTLDDAHCVSCYVIQIKFKYLSVRSACCSAPGPRDAFWLKYKEMESYPLLDVVAYLFSDREEKRNLQVLESKLR